MNGRGLQRGAERSSRRRTGEKPEKTPLAKGAVWREAREIIWQHRSRLAIGLALLFVNRFAGMVLPASSKYLIDEVVGKGRAELLTTIAIAAGIATLLQATTGFAMSQLLGVAAQGAIAEMRKSVQQHILRMPVSFFDSSRSGELISRVMTDAEGVRNLVGSGLVQLLGGLVTASFALGVLFWLNWRLTSITLVVLLAFGAVMAIAFGRLRPLFRKRGELNAEVTGRLGEALGGIRIVKAYTAEPREEKLFSDGIDRLLANIRKSITAVSGVGSITTLLFGVIGILMIVSGGRAIISGAMTLGDFVMYIFFTGLVATPLIGIASISTQLSEAFAGLDRIREIRSRSTERDHGGTTRLDNLDGRVEFEDVIFEYEADTPVLKGVSFDAGAGTTTALVGSSGSGKSTLISLVLAFAMPKTGQVRVDGHDIEEVDIASYRSQVGVVLQDNFLFDGTVADNILYARPDATRDEMIGVAKLAHCDEFVEGFAEGWDTVIGERGVKLSGGQRQRLAIARAILADPRILILDEATSSLDSESEAMIQDGLNELRKGRTTFVIAHRLSTIRSADQILVLEDGQIVERGTHGELMTADGRYRDLHDRQYRWESDRYINPGEDWTPEPEKADKPKPPSNKNL